MDVEEGPIGQRPRGSFGSFITLVLIILLFTSQSGDDFFVRHHYQDTLVNLIYQSGNFTAWLDGKESNFTLPDRDLTAVPIRDAILPPSVIPDPYRASYYSNVSGISRGDGKFYNISPSAEFTPYQKLAESFVANLNASEAEERLGTWNWTALTKASVSFTEKPKHSSVNVSEDIALAHGRIECIDENSKEEYKLGFEGVHFVSNGSFFGFVEGLGGSIDIRLLPSLVPESLMNETAQVISPELFMRILKLRNLIESGIIDQESTAQDDSMTCSLLMFGQIHQSPIAREAMLELEEEYRRPTGIRTVVPPKLSVDILLLSKQCGILYEMKDLEATRSGVFFRQVTSYAGVAGIVNLAMLIALSRQMAKSRTLAVINCVSRWTFFSQATIDSVFFAGHITVAIVLNGKPSMSLIVPAFIACLLFFYEAQFSVLIHQLQSSLDPPSALAPPPAPATLTPPATTGGQATPAAPTTTQPPLPQPASLWGAIVHHIQTDPQAKLWVFLFFFLVFLVRVILSPTMSLTIVALLYSSVWLPQITRSVRRGRSSHLSKEYVIVTTAGRLFFALYFLACPKNVVDVEPRPWAWVFAGFIGLQGVVLLLQDTWGPAFFLPARYKVHVYDYHPPLSTLPDAENLSSETLGDCSICMEPIHRERKTNSWSVAPCHHIFHTACLQRWLDLKNICPQCRRPLPPL